MLSRFDRQVHMVTGLGIAGTGMLYARQPQAAVLQYGRRS
jgi:hypothetical protein